MIVFILFALIVLAPFLSPAMYMKVVDVYPDDLVVTIKDGNLSINQPEPYFIKNPFPSEDGPKNLITIDTTSTMQSGDFQKFSTFAIVKSNYAIIDSDSNNRMMSFDKIATTTVISKSVITDAIKNIPHFVPWLIGVAAIFGGVVVALIATFVIVLFYLAYFLFLALLIQIIVRARGVILTYKEGYITAIYASIPVIILSAVMLLVHIPRPAFVFSLLLLIVAFVNTRSTTSVSN